MLLELTAKLQVRDKAKDAEVGAKVALDLCRMVSLHLFLSYIIINCERNGE